MTVGCQDRGSADFGCELAHKDEHDGDGADEKADYLPSNGVVADQRGTPPEGTLGASGPVVRCWREARVGLAVQTSKHRLVCYVRYRPFRSRDSAGCESRDGFCRDRVGACPVTCPRRNDPEAPALGVNPHGLPLRGHWKSSLAPCFSCCEFDLNSSCLLPTWRSRTKAWGYVWGICESKEQIMKYPVSAPKAQSPRKTIFGVLGVVSIILTTVLSGPVAGAQAPPVDATTGPDRTVVRIMLTTPRTPKIVFLGL